MSFNSPGDQFPKNNPYSAGSAPVGKPIPGNGQPQPSVCGILSLVFGCLSLPLTFCCGCFSLPLGVTAIILGIIGIMQVKAGTHTGAGLAYGGVATGGVSLVIFVVLLVLQIVFHVGQVGVDQFDF